MLLQVGSITGREVLEPIFHWIQLKGLLFLPPKSLAKPLFRGQSYVALCYIHTILETGKKEIQGE